MIKITKEKNIQWLKWKKKQHSLNTIRKLKIINEILCSWVNTISSAIYITVGVTEKNTLLENFLLDICYLSTLQITNKNVNEILVSKK